MTLPAETLDALDRLAGAASGKHDHRGLGRLITCEICDAEHNLAAACDPATIRALVRMARANSDETLQKVQPSATDAATVERVAVALYLDAHGADETGSMPSWADAPESWKPAWRDKARAALAALGRAG